MLTRLQAILLPLVTLVLGFGIGSLQSEDPHDLAASVIPIQKVQEISLIQLKSIEGDELVADISGPVRILWNDQMVENDGTHRIPLGQLETEEDREFYQFAYVGNAKTMKFYPADSYPARGTHPRDRRFLDSKEAAVDQGFVPSKLVK